MLTQDGRPWEGPVVAGAGTRPHPPAPSAQCPLFRRAFIPWSAYMTHRPSPAPSIPHRTSWQDDWSLQAQCGPEQADALHVTGADQHEAKRICNGCRVRTECLAEALDHEIEDGVWGGKTARERRVLRREHSKVKSWRQLLQELEEGHRLIQQALATSAPQRQRRGIRTTVASVRDTPR